MFLHELSGEQAQVEADARDAVAAGHPVAIAIILDGPVAGAKLALIDGATLGSEVSAHVHPFASPPKMLIFGAIDFSAAVGLRRALGARRRHIAVQFLGESFVLGIAGGVAGVLLRVGATGAYAAYEGQTLLVPPVAVAGGLAVASLLGGVAAASLVSGVAGLYPAMRAARLTPTEALRTA